MPSGPSYSTRSRRRSSRRSDWSTLQRIRRRDLILLAGAMSLACLSALIVLWLIWPDRPLGVEVAPTPSPTPGPRPTYTVAYAQVTGLSQYPPAEAAARQWSSDAQLVGANANWPELISRDQLGLPGEWNYRFYSPQKERLFNVIVQPDGQVASFEHRVRITLPPPPLDRGAWMLDSPAALAIWLDYGGAEMMRTRPGLEVLIQLRHLNNYPEPVWMVVGSDKNTQEIYMVVIDAKEGRVVVTSPAL